MEAKLRRQRARPTVTEQARQAQIITAATETIAELGYAHASFAQIARRAGLSSTGLISYHFASKQELDAAVVAEIYRRLTQHMTETMAGIASPAAALVAYIRGLIGFMQIEPSALRAMIAIVMHGGFDYNADSERNAVAGISAIRVAATPPAKGALRRSPARARSVTNV